MLVGMERAKERLLNAYGYIQLALGLSLWGAIALWGPPGAYSFSSAPARVLGLGSAAGFLVILVSLFAASWAAVRVKFRMAGGYYISFDISFATAAFFLVSPAAGTALAALTSLVDFAYRAKDKSGLWPAWTDTLFGNVGNRLLRFGSAWIVYKLAGGELVPTAEQRELWPAVAAFLAYFLVNNLFYMPRDFLKGEDLKAYMKDTFTVDVIHSFAICSLGFLMVLVVHLLGFGSFVMLGGFILSASWLLGTLTSTQAELHRRVEDLTILSRVSAAASSGLDVMPMVESYTRALAESLPTDGIGVVFYQRYANAIYLVQVEGGKSRSTYLSEEKRFQYDQLPLSEPSKRLGERLFEFLMPLETAPFMIPDSVFGLPLMHGGEPFGGIVVYSYKKGVPLDEREWLLQTCGQTLVVALENCFLHLQAIQDPLTGLYNRSYFIYRLDEELAYSSRHRAPFALLMLALDDFKAVNDHLGHSGGDKVLHRIGELLRKATRREDVPARYGGDEFIMLLLNCPPADAMEKAERVRAMVAASGLPKEEAFGLHLGCSVSVLHSDDLKGEQDLPNILRRLDEALYQAKDQGKNRIVRADG